MRKTFWALQDPDPIIQQDAVASELMAYRTQLFGLQVDTQNLSIASLQHTIAVLRRIYAMLVTRIDNLIMDLDETIEDLLSASENFQSITTLTQNLIAISFTPEVCETLRYDFCKQLKSAHGFSRVKRLTCNHFVETVTACGKTIRLQNSRLEREQLHIGTSH